MGFAKLCKIREIISLMRAFSVIVFAYTATFWYGAIRHNYARTHHASRATNSDKYQILNHSMIRFAKRLDDNKILAMRLD